MWRRRPKNNNKAWIKLSEAILNILGDCLSVPCSQQDWWKSSQPARCNYNLTYLEVSQQTYVQTLLASLGVAIGAKFRPSVMGRGVFGRKIGVTYRRNSPFQWWGRGGGEGLWQITHSSYSTHKIPQTPWIIVFPATLSLQGHIISSTSPSQKIFFLKNRYFEEQIHLGAPAC